MKVLKLGQSLCSSNNQGTSFTNGYSIEFDGTDDYLNLGDSNTFSFGNGSTDTPFSLSIWYNSPDVTSSGVITKTGTATDEREYYLYIGGNDKLYFTLWDDSTGGYVYSYTNATLTSTQGSWNHIAATYDGSGANTGQTIYINGVSQTLTRASGTIGSGAYVAMENTDYPLKVGMLLDSYNFTGNLDEASMWNKELSSGTITAIYNSGKPTNLSGESGLIGWWRMGDPNGTAAYPTIIDQSTNSNNATMTNMASSDIVASVP